MHSHRQRVCVFDAVSQVNWLTKLVDLCMKEGTSMPNHLNEFTTIFIQLSVLKIAFDDFIKVLFLLVYLTKKLGYFPHCHQ